MQFVSDKFKTHVHQLYGERADVWLQELPALLDRCEGRFGIRLQGPFPDLSWNLLLKAERPDGKRAVVKIAVEKEELSCELYALKAFVGRGGVHVIDADRDLGALVLEHVVPGTPLSTITDDDVATRIFCNVFQTLHGSKQNLHGTEQTLRSRFPSVRDHFAVLDRYSEQCKKNGNSGPLPAHWVHRAKACLEDLISSTREHVLLHGDLHHGNILQSSDHGWVVIDPKGIIGDLHFDVIQYLLNHVDRGGDTQTVLNRRMDIICECLGLDSGRIAMWGIARGVLEACWILEDGRGDWHKGIQITERFATYLAENGKIG
ncbi:aminoglycoside phosphotransferase family protein [Alicyclobacillus ferrooxydans]|uniref:Aminoglycoside/hydroxyurea antibiotic resistance kinase n=1 Tax=Alicyclobacillus ferrooxydans TaxID=471514 RepID=A0A0P9GT37_9BACL|nr:aminoglycoside phosphotransferase family protein [Alicyclobacillus ferrooxydans]KPV44273.1 hypothetical protein AN477_08240 [Alicyclobacillus ferrooxydans]